MGKRQGQGQGHRTWGNNVVKKRVRLVFQVLLNYVALEEDDTKVSWYAGQKEVKVNHIKLEYFRQQAKQYIQQLTDLRLKKELEGILGTVGSTVQDAETTRRRIGEAISQYINKVLPSFTDLRENKDKAAGNWHFKITLWYEYEGKNKLEQFKKDNLAEFDKAWDNKAKEFGVEPKLGSHQKTSAVEQLFALPIRRYPKVKRTP